MGLEIVVQSSAPGVSRCFVVRANWCQPPASRRTARQTGRFRTVGRIVTVMRASGGFFREAGAIYAISIVRVQIVASRGGYLGERLRLARILGLKPFSR